MIYYPRIGINGFGRQVRNCDPAMFPPVLWNLSEVVHSNVVNQYYHLSPYAIAVTPRHAKIVCDLMKFSLREENTAPLVTMRSLAIWGSEITTKS
jgi:hypothetical protein